MSDTTTAVPEGVAELFAIFKDKLPEVVFPDVSLELLEKLVEGVDQSSKEVTEALQQVEAAQEKLSAAQEELLQKSSKALAYARIFADGDEALLEQLSGVQLGKQVRAAKKIAAKPKRASQPKPKKEDEAASGDLPQG